MITPRATRLVRVPGLRAFRAAILRLIEPRSVPIARRTAVIVPSCSAAEHLRRAIEDANPDPGGTCAIPHLLTRTEWHEALFASQPDLATELNDHEREVVLESSAYAAIEAGFSPPFRLRPGLVAEMLALYDAVRRHGRGVADLQHAADEIFAPYLETDAGASRLLEQAQFLVEAFRRYEARLAASGVIDEHGIRERVLASPGSPFRRVIVAVGDATGDAGGLWPADFDLLTRIHGLERLDVVATEAALGAGLLPRLRRWLPGLSEERDTAPPGLPPTLMIPPGAERALHFLYRDREEEVSAVAKRVKVACRASDAFVLSRTGIVFSRPLPYVYLASRIFSEAGVPFDTFDALPLAAEPYAAALDLVMECVESRFSRHGIIATLRSPHFGCGPDGRMLPPEDAARLDRALSDARYLGEAPALFSLAARWQDRAHAPEAPAPGLLAAAQAAVEVVRALAPIADEARPAGQIALLLRFLDRFEILPAVDDDLRERHVRARAAVRGVLRRLSDAHQAWHDEPGAFADTASRIRRWIEQQTFAPRAGRGGVQLLDAQAARFAGLDCVYLVGLVRSDWPDRRRRNIFFPASFLKHLGWPDDDDPRAEIHGWFEDLVGLARSQVSVSSIILDDDAIVEPSALLDDVEGMRLDRAEQEPIPAATMLLGEALACTALPADALPEPVRAWVALRETQTRATDPRYHGRTGGAGRPSYRVSAIDRYLDCPFKYFAVDVLRLAEEPTDEESPGPRARGQATHDALQQFFERWQRSGRGAITPDNVADARTSFARVVEDQVSTLSAHEAALHRAGLLGSPVTVGAGEIVFEHEIERPASVVERLLEFSLDGETELRCGDRTRALVLHARADRIDLIGDGTFRLVDYKLTRAPKAGRSVQLAAYAAAARARLAGYRGRDWRVADAGYVTFGRPPHYRPIARHAFAVDATLAAGEARLVEAVERIEGGRFPPQPAEKRLCTTCSFAAVCRRDYVDAD